MISRHDRSLVEDDLLAASALLQSWALATGREIAPPPRPAPFIDPAPKADILHRIAPESLCIPGYDDRQEGDPDRNSLPLDEAMVLSVMAVGVLEPILVRRRDDGAYEVIAGRRRTRHAREANRRLGGLEEKQLSVPIIIKGARLSSEMATVVDQTLNEHRYNDRLSVKIRKAKKMLDRGIDIRTVAIAFGRDVRTIERSWLPVAAGCQELQQAVDDGLGIEAAQTIASMPLEEQPEALEKMLAIPTETGRRPVIVARSVRRREPLPGRVPPRAVRWVLAAAERYSDDFIAGVRFVRGELSEERVREILAVVGR